MDGQYHSQAPRTICLTPDPEREHLLLQVVGPSGSVVNFGRVVWFRTPRPRIELENIPLGNLPDLYRSLLSAPHLAHVTDLHIAAAPAEAGDLSDPKEFLRFRADLRYILQQLEADGHWTAGTKEYDRLWASIDGKPCEENAAVGYRRQLRATAAAAAPPPPIASFWSRLWRRCCFLPVD